MVTGSFVGKGTCTPNRMQELFVPQQINIKINEELKIVKKALAKFVYSVGVNIFFIVLEICKKNKYSLRECLTEV